MNYNKYAACTMTKQEQQIIFDLFEGTYFKDSRKIYFSDKPTLYSSHIDNKIGYTSFTKDSYGVEKQFGYAFITFQEFLSFIIETHKIKKNY